MMLREPNVEALKEYRACLPDNPDQIILHRKISGLRRARERKQEFDDYRGQSK